MRHLETSGKRGIVIAKDLGISDTILDHWRKELRATGGAAFPGKGQQTELEEEVRRLRRAMDTLRQERDILKKAAAIFCTALGEICVHDPAPEGVSREPAVSCVAGITKWLVCLEKARSVAPPPGSSGPGSADESRIFHEGRGISGSPRLHAALQQQGRRCSRKRVVRLMHQAGFTATWKQHTVRTTDSQHAHPTAPNLLQRDFAAQRPNEKWVGDITGIWTQQGWLSLAGIVEWYLRLVVGWVMSATRDETLVEQALHMALQRRHPDAGLLQHTDRGSHYISTAYRALLAERDIPVSMSRKGDVRCANRIR